MLPLWLPPQSRIAILGAGGWFGRTARALLDQSVPLLLTGSRERPGIQLWDEQTLREFAPSLILNFAFLTRERESDMGTSAYQRANETLTQQFLRSIELPSVVSAVTISSGAAITEPESTYGRLKRAEEEASLALADSTRAVLVGRAYSVSGPFVRRPQDYAFSDLIEQALRGDITVRAERPTFRRYICVRDYIEVCMRTALCGDSGVIESGGALVEMRELAATVAATLNPDARINFEPYVSDESASYASDNSSWMRACADLGVIEMDLEAQIRAVANWLRTDDRYDESGRA